MFLYDYGINLGIAFQIIDDILDYTEDQSTIGKPAGNDLRQGMVTLPLIYALQEQPQDGLSQKVQPSAQWRYITPKKIYRLW